MEYQGQAQSHKIEDDKPAGKNPVLHEWQEWVKAGVKNYGKYKDWCEKGDRLIRGDYDAERIQIMAGDSDPKARRPRVNFVRRRIMAGIDQVYARNPRVTARAKKPYFVTQDPQTGAVTKADERVFDPQTGQETTIDISDQRAEVVEAVMNKILADSDLKAEAKSLLREGYHRPASWLEAGYEFSQENQTGAVYFRWRSFKRVIVDPQAEIRDGVIRKCRYIGVLIDLPIEEAASMGLNVSALKMGKESTPDDKDSSDKAEYGDDEKYAVYRLWDIKRRQVGYVCEHGDEFVGAPAPWPWSVDSAPFACLKMAEDTDKQFSRPPILEAEFLQDELNQMRETMFRHVVNARPVNLFDPSVLDKEKVSVLAGRGADGWVGVDGLSEKPNAIQQFFDDSLPDQFWAHYGRNESELDMVLGVSANDALQVTKATAAEAQNVAAQSATQQGAKIDVLEDCLRKAIRYAKQIMESVYTEEMVSEVVGRDGSKYWVRWTGAEILAECDVDIEVGSTERRNDVYEKQLAVNMLSTVMPLRDAIDVPRLAIEMLKKNGFRNADSYRIQPNPQQVMPPQAPQQGQPAGASGGSTEGMDTAGAVLDQANPIK